MHWRLASEWHLSKKLIGTTSFMPREWQWPALTALDTNASLALVDGTYSPLYEGPVIPSIPVVDGDAKCLSIAAASIVAKVHPDRLMAELGDTYPQYGFAQNAGYGTPVHLKALDKHGPTEYHRRSFAPVQRYLQARLDI